MGWVAGNKGALEAPVELVEHADSPLATWTLRSVGEAIETQRRNYVRLRFDTEISMYLIEGSHTPVKAHTLDISEGGARVQLDKWAIDPGGRIFAIELPFHDKTFFLHAQMAWWGNLGENDIRVAGIRFHEIEQVTADLIRKYIFAAQLEERRRQNA